MVCLSSSTCNSQVFVYVWFHSVERVRILTKAEFWILSHTIYFQLSKWLTTYWRDSHTSNFSTLSYDLLDSSINVIVKFIFCISYDIPSDQTIKWVSVTEGCICKPFWLQTVDSSDIKSICDFLSESISKLWKVFKLFFFRSILKFICDTCLVYKFKRFNYLWFNDCFTSTFLLSFTNNLSIPFKIKDKLLNSIKWNWCLRWELSKNRTSLHFWNEFFNQFWFKKRSLF